MSDYGSIIKECINEGMWISKSGEEFYICDMSTQHLQNTIIYLCSSGLPYADEYIELMQEELNKRD